MASLNTTRGDQMINTIKIKIDDSFCITGSPVGAIAQYSEARVILLSPMKLENNLFFSWITPGNVKISERPLWRFPEEDVGGMFAYIGKIDVGMTGGNIGDKGISMISFRYDHYATGFARITVLGSIAPESSFVFPDMTETLLTKIRELEDRVAVLEAR